MTALPSLVELTRLFSKRRILVVGDLVADHYIYGQTERVSREAPVLIVRYQSAEVALGGGANAAANVRSLGAQVVAVGMLGNDDMGKLLRGRFKAEKISLQAASSPQISTETKTRILAGGRSTTRQQMLRLDCGTEGEFPLKLRRALVQAVTKAAQSADAILVSDYGAGVVGQEVRSALIRLARQGQLLCIDSRRDLKHFAGATVCKPNEPELAELTGLPVDSEKEVLTAAKRARAMLRCESLVVTRGRKGMLS